MAIFLLKITLFRGIFYNLSAFSIENFAKSWPFILQFPVPCLSRRNSLRQAVAIRV